MDLDKLKETWQSAEIKSSIDEDKIQRILNFRGQRAFNKIRLYEKSSLIASATMIFVGILFIILSYSSVLNTEKIIVPIFITISSILIFIWNIYKIRFFNKIDIARMDVISISKSMNTYKKYLATEGIIAFAWTVAFAAIFVSSLMFHLNWIKQIIFGVSICIFISLISYLAYKFTIKKDLKTIKKSIQEIEEIEKENIE